jgi:hypothetical protein
MYAVRTVDPMLTGLALILFALWGFRFEKVLFQTRRELKELKNGKTFPIDYGKGRDGSV